MDLKRRSFLKLVGFFSFAAFGNCSALLADVFKERFDEIKGLSYSGRVKSIDEKVICSQAKWLG